MSLILNQSSHFSFNNSYIKLPSQFYYRQNPTPVRKPNLIKLNYKLAEQLKIDPNFLRTQEGIEIISGNRIASGSDPLSMAYAGHQFGTWVPQLGDGRAVMLGEVLDKNNKRYDIQLKGAGLTPFSRMGDGRACLGPVLREYIISEAMFALNIPTTRALAAVTTGEIVQREENLPGAILTRIASSHIRIGTFQYFAAKDDLKSVKQLADHVIDRHYNGVEELENPYIYLLKELIKRQSSLISKWLGVGFIHGVMNTDNMTLSGETIDYGPCAFMDNYNANTVYSSIDQFGRYAYNNQAQIAKWNLGCFAASILPLINKDTDASIKIAKELIEEFDDIFNEDWTSVLRSKLGLKKEYSKDLDLGSGLLQLMEKDSVDFTNAFRNLSFLSNKKNKSDKDFNKLFADKLAINNWLSDWRDRLNNEKIGNKERKSFMLSCNPAYIPRNHRVEEAIKNALNEDYDFFNKFCEILSHPFEEQPLNKDYLNPPLPNEVVLQTFCGT